MHIDILTRQETGKIDPEEWDNLSQLSENVNPFYERWCLLPALKYLEKNKEIYVVVVYEKNRLTALFPIQLRKHKLGIRYLTIWQHSQCFLCDPLCTNQELLFDVIHIIMVKMNVSIFELPLHTRSSFGLKIEQDSMTFHSYRGSVTNFSDIMQHFENLPRRSKSENRRITKRLFKITGATYVNSKIQPDRDWLHDYCQLENSGWKGTGGGSILASPEIYAYYSDVCRVNKDSGQVEFQGLFNNNEALAISIRISSRNRGFDLKTTYNEDFKEFYPGVVLEIQNLEALLDSELDELDSCTSANNRVINRIWPNRLEINLSYYFDRGLIGQMLHTIYKMKHRRSNS